MKTIIFASVAALVAMTSLAPVSAATMKSGFQIDTAQAQVDRRRPRVPGGSGCDSPRDLIQHPECRG